MKNPWKQIYKGKRSGEDFIVAEADKAYIEKFLESENYNLNLKEENYKLHFNMMPQQFIGDISKAKVIFLSNNPRYNEDYLDQYLHTDGYKKIVEDNLKLATSTKFHAFDLSVGKRGNYWSDIFKAWFPEKITEKIRLNELKVNRPEEFGEKEELLNNKLDNFFTENIAIADFFPYYSIKFDRKCEKLANNDYLPSQKFVFETLRERIKNENDEMVVILLRGQSLWHSAIPELKGYKNRYHITNYRNPSVKPEFILDLSENHVKEKIEQLLNRLKK